ncbi:MAG: hypothetical protein P4L46_25505 [Fimbriimonas sp.]|nr:hypothetical protein [Fimbriimonas sp.]
MLPVENDVKELFERLQQEIALVSAQKLPVSDGVKLEFGRKHLIEPFAESFGGDPSTDERLEWARKLKSATREFRAALLSPSRITFSPSHPVALVAAELETSIDRFVESFQCSIREREYTEAQNMILTFLKLPADSNIALADLVRHLIAAVGRAQGTETELARLREVETRHNEAADLLRKVVVTPPNVSLNLVELIAPMIAEAKKVKGLDMEIRELRDIVTQKDQKLERAVKLIQDLEVRSGAGPAKKIEPREASLRSEPSAKPVAPPKEEVKPVPASSTKPARARRL